MASRPLSQLRARDGMKTDHILRPSPKQHYCVYTAFEAHLCFPGSLGGFWQKRESNWGFSRTARGGRTEPLLWGIREEVWGIELSTSSNC